MKPRNFNEFEFEISVHSKNSITENRHSGLDPDLFGAYISVTRGFLRQTAKNNQARSAIQAKRSVEKILSSIRHIESLSPDRIRFTTTKGDSSCTMQVTSGVAAVNDKKLSLEISKFAFEWLKPANGATDAKMALLWQAELRSGGWIGGAVEAK